MMGARRHDETRNARRDFGLRGTWGDFGYAYCVREGAYHYGRAHTSAITTHGVRLSWPLRMSPVRGQRRKGVRVVRVEPNAHAIATYLAGRVA